MAPESYIQLEVVIRSDVVPIARNVVHEVDTESRPDPRDLPMTSSAELLQQALFEILAQRFRLAIHLSVIFEEALQRRDRGGGWDRMSVVRAREENPL